MKEIGNILELKVGDFCSIKEWLSHPDNSWRGSVLRVIHTEGNLIYCEEYLPKSRRWEPIGMAFQPGETVAMIKLSKNPFKSC